VSAFRIVISVKIKKLSKHHPVFSAVLFFVVAQVIALSITYQEGSFLEANNIYVPTQPEQTITLWPGTVTSPSGEVTQTPVYSSLGPIVIYFVVVTAGLSLILLFVPRSALKLILRLIFAFLFAWGAFIAFVFWIPFPGAIAIAAAVGVIWFLVPIVWFHDLAMIVALASLGTVFGRFISPWTAMAVMGVLAIYDILAVRFGFMLWLTGRLSRVGVLPALVIPKIPSQWRANLRRGSIANLVDQKPAERDYSLLGGGDIAFPCLLTVSVYYAQGLTTASIIAASTLSGLTLAYLTQAGFLKGKAVPALPPIAALAFIGLLIIR
jgi:presenilin-like A22 family membrane protease